MNELDLLMIAKRSDDTDVAVSNIIDYLIAKETDELKVRNNVIESQIEFLKHGPASVQSNILFDELIIKRDEVMKRLEQLK